MQHLVPTTLCIEDGLPSSWTEGTIRKLCHSELGCPVSAVKILVHPLWRARQAFIRFKTADGALQAHGYFEDLVTPEGALQVDFDADETQLFVRWKPFEDSSFVTVRHLCEVFSEFGSISDCTIPLLGQEVVVPDPLLATDASSLESNGQHLRRAANFGFVTFPDPGVASFAMRTLKGRPENRWTLSFSKRGRSGKSCEHHHTVVVRGDNLAELPDEDRTDIQALLNLVSKSDFEAVLNQKPGIADRSSKKKEEESCDGDGETTMRPTQIHTREDDLEETCHAIPPGRDSQWTVSGSEGAWNKEKLEQEEVGQRSFNIGAAPFEPKFSTNLKASAAPFVPPSAPLGNSNSGLLLSAPFVPYLSVPPPFASLGITPAKEEDFTEASFRFDHPWVLEVEEMLREHTDEVFTRNKLKLEMTLRFSSRACVALIDKAVTLGWLKEESRRVDDADVEKKPEITTDEVLSKKKQEKRKHKNLRYQNLLCGKTNSEFEDSSHVVLNIGQVAVQNVEIKAAIPMDLRDALVAIHRNRSAATEKVLLRFSELGALEAMNNPHLRIREHSFTVSRWRRPKYEDNNLVVVMLDRRVSDYEVACAIPAAIKKDLLRLRNRSGPKKKSGSQVGC